MQRLALLPQALILALATTTAPAANCHKDSIGVPPLTDLGKDLYLGAFEGGLYPGGANVPPADHDAEGRARALAIEPLGASGAPSRDGVVVLMSVGMSNAAIEFCSNTDDGVCTRESFTAKAELHADVDHARIRFANGARRNEVAENWVAPDDQNYDRIREIVLPREDLTEAQVQVVWVKLANQDPTVSLPAVNADAHDLAGQLGKIVRAIRENYPNCRMIFLTSRIYGGYASTTASPEPFAFESGFAVKWLIEAQIEQARTGVVDPIFGDLALESTPWLGWGPYLWADGLTPRSDGLTWSCADFRPDGTHPSNRGVSTFTDELLDFFLDSPYTQPWFTRPERNPDLDGDGDVDFGDVIQLISRWGACAETPCHADLDGDGTVGFLDLLELLAEWGA